MYLCFQSRSVGAILAVLWIRMPVYEVATKAESHNMGALAPELDYEPGLSGMLEVVGFTLSRFDSGSFIELTVITSPRMDVAGCCMFLKLTLAWAWYTRMPYKSVLSDELSSGSTAPHWNPPPSSELHVGCKPLFCGSCDVYTRQWVLDMGSLAR